MTDTVDWDQVRPYVARLVLPVSPLAGTAPWCDLDDDDPRKIAALITAGNRWVLEEHMRQLRSPVIALKDATVALSQELPWQEVAKRIKDRDDFYRQHPDLKRRRAA